MNVQENQPMSAAPMADAYLAALIERCRPFDDVEAADAEDGE